MKSSKNVHQAMTGLAAEEVSCGVWEIYEGPAAVRLEVRDGFLCDVLGDASSIRVDAEVGAICKFVHATIARLSSDVGTLPPEKLKGNTAGGFEEILMDEASRLEKLSILTMGRYPVASVMRPGSSVPLQVPSLPDFEGVMRCGQQFIIEAKVCSESAFKIEKGKLKPKQVRHMLLRDRFNVPCFLMIHFNARQGKTFYDPPFTVGVRIRPESCGGIPIWEKFAADKKGTYAGSIDRDTLKSIGTLVEWHTPPRCRSPRPNLQKFLEAHA